MFALMNFIFNHSVDNHIFPHMCDEIKIQSIKELLNDLPGFKQIKSIQVVDKPSLPGIKEGGHCISYLLTPEFVPPSNTDTLYIHELSVTMIYDPTRIYEDNICVTPSLYDSNTFEPFREISVRWNPSSDRGESTTELDMEKLLIDKFKHGLSMVKENKTTYKLLPRVLIRGLFI
jgi:hypothetical protein